MQFFGKTDVGRTRNNNQDSFAVAELMDDAIFAVVCDGMGGANGGNVASSLAVKVVSKFVINGYRLGMSERSVKNLLTSAIENANTEIFNKAVVDETLTGMGTTIVAAIIKKSTVYIAHAGDSRAYLIRNNQITQLTKDHSIVQNMIETGQINAEDAKYHPRKNVITRALGVARDIVVDYNQENLCLEDIVLICTDGLTNFVSNQKIIDIVLQNKLSDVVQALIDRANKAGGEDNITVVLLKNSDEKITESDRLGGFNG